MKYKAEHLTFMGSSVVRDSNDIYPETVEYFKPFQAGSVTGKIDRSPFTCKVTVDKGMAIFDLSVNGNIFCTTVCCFEKADKEPAMLYVKDLASIFGKHQILSQPKLDCFLYSIVVNPFACSPAYSQIAGEIEFYIYDAIRRGIYGDK